MKQKIFSTVILLFISTIAFSQTAKVDSMINAADKQKEDTLKVRMLVNISQTVVETDIEKAMQYAEKAIKLAVKLDYRNGLGVAYNSKGLVYYYGGLADSAVHYFTKSLEIQKELKNYNYVTKALINIGLIQFYQGNYKEALEKNIEALEFSKKTNDKVNIASAEGNIGLVYFELGQYEKATKHTFNSLKQFELIDSLKIQDVKVNISLTLENIGHIYEKQGFSDKAVDYYKKALKVSNENADIAGIASISLNMGNSYSGKNKNDSALYFYKYSLKIREENKYFNEMQTLYNNIGDIYRKEEDFEKALQYHYKALIFSKKNNLKDDIAWSYGKIGEAYTGMKKYNKAELHLDSCMQIADEIAFWELKKGCYSAYANLYKEMKNFGKAFEYQNKFITLNDSLLEEASKTNILNMQIAYETEKKEQQIEIQEKENQVQKAEIKAKQRTIWLGLIGIIILVLSGIAFYLQRQKSIRQKHEKQMLKMQVETQEATRQELASSLHSGAGSKLSAIIINLQNKDTENKLSEEIGRLREHYEVIRSKSHILAIPSFIQTTIEDEINDIATTFKTENQNVNCSIFSNKGWKDIHPIIQQTIYRISQELLNNTTKHAGATEIELQIIRHPNYISLMYEDNGKGYNPQEIKQNYGYQKEIIDKIEFIKGSFTDDSLIGQGANLSFKFPLNYEA